MKSFRFNNIWLLSHRDMKARHVNFHPHKNLILGRNHTGKTSLIRSLFQTLGAKPEGKLELWDENTVSLVEFSVGDNNYFALHQNGHRALFDANKELIETTYISEKWAELFSGVVDFNLVFSDKESEVRSADPACFFLPFYINQDGSWQSEWNTFKGMKKSWGAILEYFTGVCPPEYYRLKAERDQEIRQLDEQKREIKSLERARERFGRSLPLSGPKIHAENFEHEIALLTQEVSILNQEQEKLRSVAVREHDLLTSLEYQINLAQDALVSYDRDLSYLRNNSTAPLVCPVCHAEHAKSFLDVFTYAEDARVVRDLVSRLYIDAAEVRKEYKRTALELKKLNENYTRISYLLDTRRGKLNFKDVVVSMGAENAFMAFEVERKTLQNQINSHLGLIDKFDERMIALRNPKRVKAIIANFREYYTVGRVALALPNIDTEEMRLTSRPDLSGSGGPRSILAYYAALWRTCSDSVDAYNMPIVIDSPNQQGQDDINLPMVLKFIARELPADAQLIVGLESSADFQFDKEFRFETQYSLLIKNEWKSVNSFVEPLLQKMYLAMHAQDASLQRELF